MKNPWILAARPKTLPAGAAPVLLGGALAYQAGSFAWAPWAICLVFALLMQVACNFANDYFDHVRGNDTKERVGPKRMVASGVITPRKMLLATLLTLGIGFCVGLGLLAYAPGWIFWVGVVIVAGALSYSGGPVPLSSVGLGDVLVLAFYGLVAVGFTYFVLAGNFTWEAWELGLIAGLLANNILIVNNYRDWEEDKAVGKKTLTVFFGRGFSFWHYVVNFALAMALTVDLAMELESWGAYLPLLIVPVGVKLCRELATTKEPAAQNALLAKTAKLMMIYSVLFVVGCVVLGF